MFLVTKKCKNAVKISFKNGVFTIKIAKGKVAAKLSAEAEKTTTFSTAARKNTLASPSAGGKANCFPSCFPGVSFAAKVTFCRCKGIEAWCPMLALGSESQSGCCHAVFWAIFAQNARLLSWRSAESGQTHSVQTCLFRRFRQKSPETLAVNPNFEQPIEQKTSTKNRRFTSSQIYQHPCVHLNSLFPFLFSPGRSGRFSPKS
jgi:hypothetical protein